MERTTTVTDAAIDAPGIVAGRLAACDYAARFSDSHPPLNAIQAQIEAERCYYCFDAPCTKVCPTSINVPQFIHRIAQGNVRGAAETILEANPLGGMCARVCPTENLCERDCVRSTNEAKPVEIGLRHHAHIQSLLGVIQPAAGASAGPAGGFSVAGGRSGAARLTVPSNRSPCAPGGAAPRSAASRSQSSSVIDAQPFSRAATSA